MRSNPPVRHAALRDAVPTRPTHERIGIVFVHGIGQQPESGTVRQFGGVLLGWLREWYGARGLALEVESASLSYGQRADPPARFAVRLPDAAQTWVFAEAWWASRLSAPSFAKMVGWALVVVWRVLDRLWRSFTKNGSLWVAIPRPLYERAIRAASAFFLLIGVALAAALYVPFLALFFLLAQLPGPFERAVLALRLFLVDQIGDFYTFLNDDVQARHIHQAVADSVKHLVTQERCGRIVVMAHSQGAVVAFDALSSSPIPEIKAVSTLVTVGGALNNAWRLRPSGSRRLRGDLPGHIRWLDVWADYDYVAGGTLVRPGRAQASEDVPVMNTLNVITDHGGYFTNREEFLSLLAQEVNAPGAPQTSRFRSPDTERWIRRRRDRVLTMVSWRLVAFILFAAAMLSRMRPLDRLGADGDAAGLWLGKLPLLGGVVDALTNVAGWLSLRPPVSDAFARLFGMGVWVAAYTLLFVALYSLVFGPWHEAEGRRSLGTAPPPATQRLEIIVTSALVLLGLFAGAWSIVDLPPLPRPVP